MNLLEQSQTQGDKHIHTDQNKEQNHTQGDKYIHTDHLVFGFVLLF
jgi:hypothetical protein